MENSVIVTADMLIHEISALPHGQGVEAAHALLTSPDLFKVAPEGEHVFSPAKDWLAIYREKQKESLKAGTQTYGFPALLKGLENLAPDEPVTLTAFDLPEAVGIFWTDKKVKLVGFLIIKKKPSEPAN